MKRSLRRVRGIRGGSQIYGRKVLRKLTSSGPGRRREGKTPFPPLGCLSIWSAEISESFNGSKLGLCCALQLKHKAMIRSLFDQVTRTLVLEVNHLKVAGQVDLAWKKHHKIVTGHNSNEESRRVKKLQVDRGWRNHRNIVTGHKSIVESQSKEWNCWFANMASLC